MANKYKDASKGQPRRAPADSPAIGKNEAVVSEGHSQDADRHDKMRHPRSEK